MPLKMNFSQITNLQSRVIFYLLVTLHDTLLNWVGRRLIDAKYSPSIMEPKVNVFKGLNAHTPIRSRRDGLICHRHFRRFCESGYGRADDLSGPARIQSCSEKWGTRPSSATELCHLRQVPFWCRPRFCRCARGLEWPVTGDWLGHRSDWPVGADGNNSRILRVTLYWQFLRCGLNVSREASRKPRRLLGLQPCRRLFGLHSWWRMWSLACQIPWVRRSDLMESRLCGKHDVKTNQISNADYTYLFTVAKHIALGSKISSVWVASSSHLPNKSMGSFFSMESSRKTSLLDLYFKRSAGERWRNKWRLLGN